MGSVIEKNKPEFWFLLLLMGGYVVFSGLAVPLQVEYTRIFAVPYRVFIFLYSIYILYKNFDIQRFKSLTVFSFVLFWILYFFKAWYSFSTDAYDVEFLAKDYEVYARIFIIILLPTLATLFIDYSKIDLNKLCKYFFYILFIMLSLNLLYGIITPHNKLGLITIFTVYYISYGHLGTSLALISLYMMLFHKNLVPKILQYIGFALGLGTIVIATARSPFLALMLVSLYFVLVKKQWKSILIFFLIVLLSIIGIYFYHQSGATYFQFINRTYLWIFEGDNSLRTPLFERSIEIFKANPLIGGRVLYEDASYPHNIVLELLMATGIIGLILYFIKFLPVIRQYKIFVLSKFNNCYILFFALFAQYFVLVITSYNLFSVPEFLYFSGIIIGISLNQQNEKA